MNLLYLWRETTQVATERSIASAAPVLYASVGGEVCTHRKKYVQPLAESTLRCWMQMNELGLAVPPKKRMLERASKKGALANATNTTATDPSRPVKREPGVAPEMRMDRGMYRTRGDNNENHAEQLRRKRGQFDLYAQGVSREFSSLPKN